jgi:hypothetical protein
MRRGGTGSGDAVLHLRRRWQLQKTPATHRYVTEIESASRAGCRHTACTQQVEGKVE